MSKDSVSHEGRVVEIGEETISVEIVSQDACAACHARTACAVSGENVKIIEVPLDVHLMTAGLSVGDPVRVVLRPSLGLKAVWLAYVAPLALLLVSILVFSLCGVKEIYVGLFSVIVVIFYYLVLSFFRNRLAKVFTFTVEKV